MNEDLNKFKKKKCSSCGEYFYELSTKYKKYGIFLCSKCTNSSTNKMKDVYSLYEYMNYKNYKGNN
jgi:ribosomal protein L37AE/L43A